MFYKRMPLPNPSLAKPLHFNKFALYCNLGHTWETGGLVHESGTVQPVTRYCPTCKGHYYRLEILTWEGVKK